MQIDLGGIKLTKPAQKPQRMSLCLWGNPGCGKTTLAATAPGKKLWISFDPDGTVALNNRDDVLVADFSKERNSIIDKFKGGPVGLETIAASISEESDTIMDVYEPYLLQLGFLERTSRGRLATQLAYQHLGLPYNKEKPPQPTLF